MRKLTDTVKPDGCGSIPALSILRSTFVLDDHVFSQRSGQSNLLFLSFAVATDVSGHLPPGIFNPVLSDPDTRAHQAAAHDGPTLRRLACPTFSSERLPCPEQPWVLQLH
jgi:hypothetical protein